MKWRAGFSCSVWNTMKEVVETAKSDLEFAALDKIRTNTKVYIYNYESSVQGKIDSTFFAGSITIPVTYHQQYRSACGMAPYLFMSLCMQFMTKFARMVLSTRRLLRWTLLMTSLSAASSLAYIHSFFRLSIPLWLRVCTVLCGVTTPPSITLAKLMLRQTAWNFSLSCRWRICGKMMIRRSTA